MHTGNDKLFLRLSIAAGFFLAFTVGILIAHFDLPPYSFFRNAMDGAQALYDKEIRLPAEEEDGEAQPVSPDRPSHVTLWQRGEAFEGYTLIGLPDQRRARLIDMEGHPVHEWHIPYRQAFPKHFRSNPCEDRKIYWSRLHMYPNGDLLAVYDCDGDTPSGYGLVKLDKASQILWTAPFPVHHDLDIAPDGRIVALTANIRTKRIEGLKTPPPIHEDKVSVFSAEGRPLDSVSLLEAFRDSPYRAFVDLTRKKQDGDYLHANSVHVLTSELARAFPQFKPGQVLVSVRNINVIGVLDLEGRRMVWATRGLWYLQHHARFLPNGHIQLYDNQGLKSGDRTYSRIIEYDLEEKSIVWSFDGNESNRFYSEIRGMQQTLPNGNLLITESVGGRLLEITPDKRIVWEYYYPYTRRPGLSNPLVTALRYGKETLTFLPSTP